MEFLMKSAMAASQQNPAKSDGKTLTTPNDAVSNKSVLAAADKKMIRNDEETLSLMKPNLDSSRKLIKGTDRSMLTMSDDTLMMKQLQATHTPDGREVEVRPLFGLVEDIINCSTLYIDAVITVYNTSPYLK